MKEAPALPIIPVTVPFWKRCRYRLEYFGLASLARIIQYLPWSWLQGLGSLLGFTFYQLDRHRREVTEANLKAAQLTNPAGELLSRAERSRIGRRSYMMFARTALELLWSPNLTPEVINQIATVEELNDDLSHRQPGVAAIYYCLHAGNFEWVSQVHRQYVSAMPLIAQKMKNPLIGPLFDYWRSALGHQIIPQEGAMLRTFRHLKAGGKIGILFDLNLKPEEGPVVIKEFGRFYVPITRLPAELALRTGAKLIPIECLPRPEGGYVVRYYPEVKVHPGDSVAQITQACWDVLEQSIRRQPEIWLWSYKHWRYLPKGVPPEEYPFYANRLEAFDQLLAKEGIAPGTIVKSSK